MSIKSSKESSEKQLNLQKILAKVHKTFLRVKKERKKLINDINERIISRVCGICIPAYRRN